MLGRAPPRLSPGIISGPAGYPYVNDEARIYVAAMATKPNDTRKGVIDTFIGSLKAGAVSGSNILADLDGLWLFASHNSAAALINVITPGTGDATLVNGGTGAPTFSADHGFTTNGADNYIGLINPVGYPSVKYGQNDASFGFGSLTDSASSLSRIGQFDGADGSNITLRTGTSQANFRVNCATASSTANNACPSSAVMAVGTRSSSTSIILYLNATGSAATQTSSAVNNSLMWLGGRNSGSFIVGQFDFALVGRNLSANKITDIFNGRAAYRTSLGY